MAEPAKEGPFARQWEGVVRWLAQRDWDEGGLLMIAGAVIGLAAGLGVVAFYGLIDASYLALTAWPERHLPVAARALLRPLLTAIGVWAAWAIVRRANAPEGQNVPDVQLAVAKRDGDVPVQPVAARTLASAVTLGSGGSVGSEGPVAVLGSAVGSVLGGALRFQPRHRKILVGCGAGAGIAGAFNAPFAGAFFALEEILGSFSVGAFSPVVIASVVGSLTVRSFMGTHPAFHIPVIADVHPVANALLYPLLGVACGILSAFYTRLDVAMPRWLRRIPGPDWVRPLVAGAVVGGITLASGGLLAGNGHLAIPGEVFGQMAWWALIALAVAKVLATVITLGGGGSGGVFTPALFIGASLGGGVGVAMAALVPGHIVHPAAWALVGMAGLVSGATRAPLTAIFIVYEMTNDSSYVVPLMIVSVVSFVVAKRFSHYGLYDGWLAARGEHLAHGVDQAIMQRLQVRDAMDEDVPRVPPNATLDEVTAAMSRVRLGALPVVESDGTLVGLIGHQQLRDALLHRASAGQLLLAEDLAERVAHVRPAESLQAAMSLMNARGRDAVPVLAMDSGAFIGLLDRSALLAAYERELERSV